MSPVLLNIDDAIATITLNRPQSLNAFNDEMASDWAKVCAEAANDDSVKAIVLAGEGRSFCAGGDVKAIYAMDNRGASITRLAREINTGILALAGSAKPVVAAAQGATAGGGLGILLCSDYAVVGESSKVGSLYAGVGLTPDLSVSALLGRAVGERRALQLTLSPRMLTAQEALSWGLAAEVVPDEEVTRRTLEVAREWVGAGHAYGQAKRLLRSAPFRSFAEQLDVEALTIGVAAETADAEERMGAFTAR